MKTASVFIREVPRELWQAMKAVAAMKGIRSRDADIEAFEDYLHRERLGGAIRKAAERGELAEPGASLAPANGSGQPV